MAQPDGLAQIDEEYGALGVLITTYLIAALGTLLLLGVSKPMPWEFSLVDIGIFFGISVILWVGILARVGSSGQEG
jgi:hypothetical protein